MSFAVAGAEAGDHRLLARDAYLLERYRQGSPRLPVDELSSPLARVLAGAMLMASSGDRDRALEERLARLPDEMADGVRCALVAVDIDRPPAALPVEPAGAGSGETGPLAPALPEPVLDGASPDAWLVAREREASAFAAPWVDLYVEYARSITPMTPELLHVSAALWLAAVAIARRLVVPMAHARVYPNLFIAWIAQTTIWHKSTALDVAGLLARDLFPHLLAANDTTPEAFLSDLAGKEPTGLAEMTDDERGEWLRERDFCAQRGLLLDEMSGLLSGAGREYNAGLIESLLRFYDCERRFTRSTRGAGRINVRNSYLSVLGASTPAALAPYLGNLRLWTMGWWPRFALLTPEEDRPPWQEPWSMDRPPRLVADLQALAERLPKPGWPTPADALAVTLGDGVFADWQRYNKAVSHDLIGPGLEERLDGVYGRLPTKLIKVATILAALEWPLDLRAPRIERHHLARAMVTTETWRESAHRVVTMGSESSMEKLASRIVRVLPSFLPGGASVRDINRRVPVADARELRETLRVLEDAGDVVRLQVRAPSGRGRPSERFLPAAIQGTPPSARP